ncbi:MAG: efflux RND transporter periplasmic adaptor subunit [Desulfurella sp.]
MKKIFALLFILFSYSAAFGLSVHIVYPETCTSNYTIKAYGKVETNQNITINAPISGIINISSSFSSVKKGEPLAQIYPYNFSNKLQNAKNNIEAARKNLEDTIKLKEANIATSQELQKAKMLYYQAESNLENLRSILEQTKIYAPFSGSLQYLVASQSYVEKGQPIAILKGNGDLWIQAFVTPDDISKLKVGQIVYYYHSNLKQQGTIAQISPSTDSSGLMPVFVKFNNKDLIAGVWVKLDIPIAQKSCLCIPKQAIVSKGSKVYVYIVINGVACEREVGLINIAGNTAYIFGNIAKNKPIVVSGMQRLKNKTKVTIMK